MDLDESTAEAWRGFQARLADRVAAMEDDELLLVEVESAVGDEDGAAPYVQLCGWGGDLVRVEAVSNHYLADQHRLDEDEEAVLVELGFSAPTYASDEEPDSGSANFHLDAERTEADRLAVVTVRALREVYGVAHPAFLDADGLQRDEDAPASEEPSPKVPAGAVAVYPRNGHDQLQSLVDEAMEEHLGRPPWHDDDGDIPVFVGNTIVWVRVLDVPVVRIFSLLVDEVRAVDRAALEVGVLNHDHMFPKFVLEGRQVWAYYHLPAWPFVPEQFRLALRKMTDGLSRVADDLVMRLGGRRWTDDDVAEAEDAEPGAAGLHPALLTLLHLEADAPGSVDPETAAAICDDDRELVLRLLEQAGADEDEATVRLLRRALRVCVRREVERRRTSAAGRGVPAHGRRPARPTRRAPDPTLEEIDPEMWG